MGGEGVVMGGVWLGRVGVEGNMRGRQEVIVVQL